MTLPDSAVEDLIRSIYRLGTVQREIARHALSELGTQGFIALTTIHKHGPARISDVAQRLDVDLSVASRQVAALVAAGYVRRDADPDDRRAHRVRTTPTGAEVLDGSHRRMVAAFAGALASWDEATVREVAGQLDRLRDDFAGASPTHSPVPQEVHP